MSITATGGLCAPLSVGYPTGPMTYQEYPWARAARRVKLADGAGEQRRLDELTAAIRAIRDGGRPATTGLPFRLTDFVPTYSAPRGGIRFIQPPASITTAAEAAPVR